MNSDLEYIKYLAQSIFSKDLTVTNVKRLGGLTNRTYYGEVGINKYVFRIPGEGTEVLINRQNEEVSTKLACKLGIDSELLFFNSDTGVKVTKYIDNAITMNVDSMQQYDNIELAALIFRKLHCSNVNTGILFDISQKISDYEKIISDNQVKFYDDYKIMKQTILNIKLKTKSEKISLTTCHNDPLCENWVRSGSKIYLIDWEYAGMNDCMWDLADISLEAEYDRNQDKFLLNKYFNRIVSRDEFFRFEANKIYIDFLWSLWGKTRVPFDGEVMEEYAFNRYNRMKYNLQNLQLF